MSVLDTIRRMSKSDVTLYRLTAGASIDSNGRAVAATYGSVAFAACVQPTSGADRRTLLEGNYKDESITVWSADQQIEPGDELQFREVRFKVVHVRRWDEFLGGWKAVCLRTA